MEREKKHPKYTLLTSRPLNLEPFESILASAKLPAPRLINSEMTSSYNFQDQREKPIMSGVILYHHGGRLFLPCTQS